MTLGQFRTFMLQTSKNPRQWEKWQPTSLRQARDSPHPTAYEIRDLKEKILRLRKSRMGSDPALGDSPAKDREYRRMLIFGEYETYGRFWQGHKVNRRLKIIRAFKRAINRRVSITREFYHRELAGFAGVFYKFAKAVKPEFRKIVENEVADFAGTAKNEAEFWNLILKQHTGFLRETRQAHLKQEIQERLSKIKGQLLRAH